MPARLVVGLLLLALEVIAQDTSADAAVRRAVSDFTAAVRSADPGTASKYLAEKPIWYSPGGTVLSLSPKALAAGFRNTAFLIRHVHFITPDAAVAIGLFRNPAAKAPYDAGVTDYSLVRIGDTWKISAGHMSYVPSPESVASSIPGAAPAAEGMITPDERKAGWEPLFDGKTNQGWVTMTGSTELPPAWRIDGGVLMSVPGKTPMALRTARSYTSFEMSFEWTVAAKGNSGIKYRLFAAEIFAKGLGGDGAGFEYQIADNDGDPGARIDPRQRSGALYGIVPASGGATKPIGEWNQSRIVLTTDHVEHWLNGIKTAEYPVDVPFPSPITIQYHGPGVQFRNLKLRPTDK